MTGIEKAIAALAVRDSQRNGGQVALAEALGISQEAVRQWKAQGYVPWERAAKVARLTGVAAGELVDPRIQELFA